MSLRRSRSRSDAGIVEFEHVGLNQHGDTVAICRRAALMKTKGRVGGGMRSLLFVPADSERKLARGLESGADALILDLEDSVAASNRPTARRLAREFLEAHGPDRIRRYVTDQSAGERSRARRSRRHGPRPPGRHPAAEMRPRGRAHARQLSLGVRGGVRRAGRRDPDHRDRHRNAAGRVRARRLCRGVAAARSDHLGSRGPRGLPRRQ